MVQLKYEKSLCKRRSAFEHLAELQALLLESEDHDIRLELGCRGRTGLTFVFLAGCLKWLGRVYGKQVTLVADEKLAQLFQKVNFTDFVYSDSVSEQLSLYNQNVNGPGFRFIRSDADILSLVREITTEAPVNLAPKLEAVLASRMSEMFLNAREHAQAEYVIGGKYFKQQKNKYCFACYDTGVGISERVNRYRDERGEERLSDVAALQWAMKDGNTTNSNPLIARGLGMGQLKSFAKLNSGAIRLCTGNALYMMNSNREVFDTLNHPFWGTIFEMDIIADNNYQYILK